MANVLSTVFVKCIDNTKYPVALKKGKTYQQVVGHAVDSLAGIFNLISIIDETGEVYMYPKEFFEEE